MIIKLVFGLMVSLLASTVVGGELPLSPVCWPLNFAGITLGVTTDSEVQRLLGYGVFREDEGDTGGRYFVDSKQTATLHTEGYTDSIIGEVTIQEGVSLKKSEVKKAISPWFKPQQGFGNWHALHLGSTKQDVKKNLGEPKKGSAKNEWRYDTKCACELEVYFTLYFKNERVYKIVFSAPAS